MIQVIWIGMMILVTVVCYSLARYLYGKINNVFCLPIVLATVMIILFLRTLNIAYDSYMEGAQWIHALLGPAVVALAYPLYVQRKLLGKLAMPLLIGSFIGAIMGVLSSILVAQYFSLDETLLFTVLPKSVTTPVAMDISATLGGISSLAAVLVIIAGITGAVSGKFIFRILQIKSAVGQGVAFGAASHAIGTAKAFESGNLEGSISTIAMIVSAVIVSLITPPIVQLFL